MPPAAHLTSMKLIHVEFLFFWFSIFPLVFAFLITDSSMDVHWFLTLGQGYGACPFFLWYDSEENTALSAQVDESSLDVSPNSSLNGHLAIQTMNYDLDEKDGLSVEHIMFESAEIDNHQLSPSINSVPLDPLENEEKALTWIEEHDDTLNMDTSTNISNLSIVLRDHHHDLVVHEGGLLNLIMDKIPQVSKQSLPAKIHCQQIEFWGGNFAAGDTLNGGIFYDLFIS